MWLCLCFHGGWSILLHTEWWGQSGGSNAWFLVRIKPGNCSSKTFHPALGFRKLKLNMEFWNELYSQESELSLSYLCFWKSVAGWGIVEVEICLKLDKICLKLEKHCHRVRLRTTCVDDYGTICTGTQCAHTVACQHAKLFFIQHCTYFLFPLMLWGPIISTDVLKSILFRFCS